MCGICFHCITLWYKKQWRRAKKAGKNIVAYKNGTNSLIGNAK
jgi:hypothetical protein